MLKEAEAFNPATDSWAPLPAMTSPRAALGAATLGGAVWAVGGQSDRATHATTERLDLGAGAWVQEGAALREPRKYLSAAALGGALGCTFQALAVVC